MRMKMTMRMREEGSGLKVEGTWCLLHVSGKFVVVGGVAET